jgi:hypothetical protein
MLLTQRPGCFRPPRFWAATLFLLGFSSWLYAAEPRYFAIHVVDDQTGRGVPMVELRTTSAVSYYTDSAGYVAFSEPGLMNQHVYFGVSSHGYDYPADAFGAHGAVLETKPGAEATVKIKRINIAQRLYRMTGAGIYRDSILLGHDPHPDQPPLNAQTTGQDGTLNAIHNGKLYWFYGDTVRLSHPLGNYSMTGAMSALPDKLDPEQGIPRNYFTKDGFVKAMAPMSGEGVIWLYGVVVLPDDHGVESMFAYYQRRRGLGELLENGFVKYNDQLEQFEKLAAEPLNPPHFPQGYPFRAREDDGHIYFTGPLPMLRVKADLKSYLDLAAYESFTCMKIDGSTDEKNIDRDTKTGRPVWTWRRGVSPLAPAVQRQLIVDGKLSFDDLPVRLIDPSNGKRILINNCSVQYNAFRKRYLMIASEETGATGLGEVWYAEADRPEGRWMRAVKIISHANRPNDAHDFYNPVHRAYLDRQGGQHIFIEGTYVNTFSGNAHATPWYEYNQQMYKLDLADPRLQN